MAIVTVQLGQCGNQIGNQLYSTVLLDAMEARKAGHHDYWEVSCERFFDSTPQTSTLRPRTVLIDMEQKVIQQSLEHSRRMKLWEYDSKCIYSQKRGSGNNWANGYCCYGPAIEEDVLSMVHRQVEKCDHLGGFLVLMSVAGGTGSGVGAHITEALRGEFPHAFLVNQVVCPSVKPYQPPGLWIEKGNFSQFLLHYKQDEGEALYRRSLYTFIRRTSPPPTMLVFDAPDRSTCFVQRQNTNTPLQALVLLNDPQFVEASRALAERIQREAPGNVAAQIRRGFRLATGRSPSAQEVSLMENLYTQEKERFAERPADIDSLFAVGELVADASLDRTNTAALTMVAQLIFNHDEAYTKR